MISKVLSLTISVIVLQSIRAFDPYNSEDWKDFVHEHGLLEKETRKDPLFVADNEWTCEHLVPSEEVPTSVHALRPGDIKIISALGDSLTAANGADASTIVGSMTEYRGLSFGIGGYYQNGLFIPHVYDSVETHFTIANALKKYNPELKGWARGISQARMPGAGLDEAVPGSKAYNLSAQARNLIVDMKSNPEYDFHTDWKLLTLFIGGNDLCQFCYIPGSTAENYRDRIKEALDILHSHVPRMFVNLVTIFNINQLGPVGEGNIVCDIAKSQLCQCVVPTPDSQGQLDLQSINGLYRSYLWELVSSGRYDTRNDFTVVIQPFLEDTEPPFLNGEPDTSFFAHDCFHFSRKGHNYAGEALWNNMFQPFGAKDLMWSLGQKLECPTEEQPFLYTSKNSFNY